MLVNVRSGSIALFSTPSDHVGSYPNNDQTGDPPRRLKRAICEITRCSTGLHSITSSARTRIDGGTVRPSTLAVLAFTAISYFTGT